MTYTALLGLSPTELEDLTRAIAISEARHEHPTRDTCERCGGHGCDVCRADSKGGQR